MKTLFDKLASSSWSTIAEIKMIAFAEWNQASIWHVASSQAHFYEHIIPSLSGVRRKPCRYNGGYKYDGNKE